MQRYFFVIHSADGAVVPDLEGIELPSVSAAVWEAQHGGRELLAEAILRKDVAPLAIVVLTEQKQWVATVQIADLVPSNLIQIIGSQAVLLDRM